MKNAIRLRWTEKTWMRGYSSFRSFSNAEIDFNVTKFHKSWNCEKLSPKESNLHTAAVCRVSKHFGENDTGQRKLRWNKEVWQQETNSVFFVVSEKKKSILGRYINTLFFITKDTNDSLILRMWCLCFFFFRGKNLPDTSCEICVDAGLSEFMRVMLYLGQNSHLLKQTFLAWRFN